MFELAALTSIGTFIVIWKMGILRLFRYKELRRTTDGTLDALLTFGLVTLFAGTFSGMIVGMTSGLMLSGLLFTVRMFTKPRKTIKGKLYGIIHRNK